MACERINALNVRLAYLKQQMCETRVALLHGIHNIEHIVHQNVGRATRHQIQIATYFMQEFYFNVVMLQKLYAERYGFRRQVRV